MKSAKKAKVRYYFEEDIFSGRPLKRSYDSSFLIGDFIFDIDKKGRISGIEILNASRLFKIPRRFLKNMESGRIELEVNDEVIKLNILIRTFIRNSHKSSALNVERIEPEFLKPSELKMAIA